MFDLREFILKGLKKGIGQLRDTQIMLNAAGWFEKGVLTEGDLAEINEEIDAQYIEEIPKDEVLGVEEATSVDYEEALAELGVK